MKISFKNTFVIFVIKSIALFLIIYYGLQIWIGLSIPGGSYSTFVDNYLDFFHLLRLSLIKGAKCIAYFFGYSTTEEAGYLLKVPEGRGVRISYGCAGIGIMSFWMAFVLSNSLKLPQKIFWLFSGLCIIWIINVLRIGLYLVALNKKWTMPFGIDQHTWFNIVAYGIILMMMYFLDKKTSPGSSKGAESLHLNINNKQ
ncbi:MAG: exosortase/archaeosortase family protein [Ferruginibacter sp.]|nr:exosortase/archaeosortase family protein [Ferruginibacter sp.]